MNYAKLIILGMVALFAAIATNWGHDLAYRVHAFLILVISSVMFIWTLRRTDEPAPAVADGSIYFDLHCVPTGLSGAEL